MPPGGKQPIDLGSVDPDRCYHTASLGHNDLKHDYIPRLYWETTQTYTDPFIVAYPDSTEPNEYLEQLFRGWYLRL